MNRQNDIAYLAVAALAGAIFGVGLYVSQMVDPLKVLHFLDFKGIPSGTWDPSLALVMAAGLIVMFGAIQIGKRWGKPLLDTKFSLPEFTKIDRPLVIGSALFGIGWGMSGICPGPAISLIAFWPPHLLVYLVALFLGSYGGAAAMTGWSDKRLALAR